MKRYLTDATHRFSCTTVRPSASPRIPEMQLVKVYPSVAYQHIIGFGAALTEAAGYVYAHMSPEDRARFRMLCFGRDGNRYSLARTSVQSCDFALVPRAYLADGAASFDAFSIDDDFAYVLPLVLDACRENAALQVLGSPWSPPAWAKTNGTMKRGGHLLREHYDSWARIIARYVADYRALGVPVTRLTVQNEPQAVQTWESCLFSARQEGRFLTDFLKPALRAQGAGDVKVLIWDHNKEGALDRASALLSDARCARETDGVAFHWYSGDHFEAVRAVRDLVGAERELIFTEGCDAFSAGDPDCELPHAEHYAHEIIGDLEAGTNAILDWNILLDQAGGPNHVGNFCDAPLMYDMHEKRLNVRLPYYYLGHFSRFIQPGARRVLSTRYTTDLETCAFANPDGTFALIVLNRTSRSIAFDLAWGQTLRKRIVAHMEAPAHSIQTVTW